MSEKSPSKDEALEALDFIVNVLKEHEKDLDRLIDELGAVAGQLGESSELNMRVKAIEGKINSIQNEVGNLVKSIEITAQQTPVERLSSTVISNLPIKESTTPILPTGTPLLVQCKQWEDFRGLAAKAQAASFETEGGDKTISIEALKNNQLITYNGQMPQLAQLLKIYLSRQLDIPEKQILEGTLTLT
jgi:hypothetical protein